MDALDKQIEEFIDAGDFTSAISTLAGSLTDQAATFRLKQARWRRFFLDPRRACPLLKAARQNRAKPNRLLDLLRSADWSQLCDVVQASHRTGDEPIRGDADPLALRTKLVRELLAPNANDENTRDVFGNCLRGYAECWGYRHDETMPESMRTADPQLPPSFFRHLCDCRLEAIFSSLAKEFGWWHPGLLLAGETAAFIGNRGPAVAVQHEVRTWILSANRRNPPSGYLAELRIRRVPDGCGAVFPDVEYGGYVRTGPGFQEGIRHAWHAARNAAGPRSLDYDYKWSLHLLDSSGEPPPDVRFDGRSAEVALACGLQAAVESLWLDFQTVVTAQFRSPGTANHSLTRVSSLDRKLLAELITLPRSCDIHGELRSR